MEDVRRDEAAQVAYSILRKKRKYLSNAVTIGCIPEDLYSSDLIDDATMEAALNKALSDREKGNKIMSQVQKTMKVKPELFAEFCQVLSKEEVTKQLAEELKESYKKRLDEVLREKTKSCESSDTELMELKDDLRTYQRAQGRPNATEAVLVCIKESIEHYIETTLKAGSVKPDDLQAEMHSLCHRDLLVPTSIRSWVLEQVKEIKKRLSGTVALPESPSQPEPVAEPELFCKDTLYHASICCHVSSSCTPENFKGFLNQQLLGHSLEQVSMSIPQDSENVDGYLIAKRENTVYVAFQSDPTLSLWLKKHASFEDGLKKQMSRIPLRFFIEQLRDRNRIVFTGFSFGGMLACCIAGNIWEMSYIGNEVLEKNVVCITFGQPLITIPFVQSVMRKFPKFEATIHSIFDKEDSVPQLLRYFRVGCLHYHKTAGTATASEKTSTSPVTSAKTVREGAKLSAKRPTSASSSSVVGKSFQEPFASFLRNLSVLQEEHTYSGVLSSRHSTTSKPQALHEVKNVLKELVSIPQADTSVVCGAGYTISCQEGLGLTWKAVLPREMDAQDLSVGADVVEKLETTLFKQHSMDSYRRKVFRSYLEKQPDKYSGPGLAREIKGVSLLTPEVKAIEFHQYPNEYAVVLEGDKLWFCHKIRISNKGNVHKIDTPVQNITRQSIQFNFTLSDGKKCIVPDNGHMEITLYSHFSEPINTVVPVKQEPYSFSLRQIQLAKHTPSEIIQLAFWSAMLEWLPKHAAHHTPSQRFQEVTHFLEEAAKVVPIESIFYAVAYNNDDIALECSKAIKAYVSNRKGIPSSEMMVEGSHLAAARMLTGICADEVDIAMQQQSAAMPHDIMFGLPSMLTPVGVATRVPESTSKPKYSDVTRHPANVTPGSHPTGMASRLHQPQTIVLPPLIVPIPVNIGPRMLQPPSDIAIYLDKLAETIASQAAATRGGLNVVCNLNIEQVYPTSPRRQTVYTRTLKSPVNVLKDAREKLASFVEDITSDVHSVNEAQSTETNNEELVEVLKDIQENELQICAALLAGFMEQQIRIPLLKSPADTAKVLSSRTAPVAVGVWALFSLSYTDLQKMLSQTQGNALLVEIADYISGIFHPEENQKQSKTSDRKYAGKLQFLLQGIKKTVSCSSQYIGYSLEHQLCNNPRFDKSIPLRKLIDNWEKIFKGDALSLVAKSHRPLIARWLKWAVLVHDLREALAKYTCVGVIGLVNSGKSLLVNTLFKLQALVGTTEQKRTTIPLMYNLDGSVDGLDVIDFPGVDDKDHCIPGLAKLLISLAQVVVFVVDYRKIHSDPAKQWLYELEAEDVPVRVCLTHADRLYAELIAIEGTPDPTGSKKQKIGSELEIIKEKIGNSPSRSIKFYCFRQEPDSTITTESLREVNIFGPLDVGNWLVKTFKHTLDQKELAEKLDTFIHGQ